MAEEDTSRKELQKLYLQMQLMQQQSQQLQQQIQSIEQQVEELEGVRDGLERLKDVKPGTEIYVPFAGGVFIKAELKDSENLLLNVGAGTAVTKPIPDTIETINAQIAEMAGLRKQMAEQLDRIIAKAKEVERNMEKLV